MDQESTTTNMDNDMSMETKGEEPYASTDVSNIGEPKKGKSLTAQSTIKPSDALVSPGIGSSLNLGLDGLPGSASQSASEKSDDTEVDSQMEEEVEYYLETEDEFEDDSHLEDELEYDSQTEAGAEDGSQMEEDSEDYSMLEEESEQDDSQTYDESDDYEILELPRENLWPTQQSSSHSPPGYATASSAKQPAQDGPAKELHSLDDSSSMNELLRSLIGSSQKSELSNQKSVDGDHASYTQGYNPRLGYSADGGLLANSRLGATASASWLAPGTQSNIRARSLSRTRLPDRSIPWENDYAVSPRTIGRDSPMSTFKFTSGSERGRSGPSERPLPKNPSAEASFKLGMRKGLSGNDTDDLPTSSVHPVTSLVNPSGSRATSSANPVTGLGGTRVENLLKPTIRAHEKKISQHGISLLPSYLPADFTRAITHPSNTIRDLLHIVHPKGIHIPAHDTPEHLRYYWYSIQRSLHENPSFRSNLLKFITFQMDFTRDNGGNFNQGDEIHGSNGLQAADTNPGIPTVHNEPAYGDVVMTRSGAIAGVVRSTGRGEDVLETMRSDIAQGRDVLNRVGHSVNPNLGAMNIDPQLGGQSEPAVPGIRLPGAPGMIIGADPAMTTNVTWSFVGPLPTSVRVQGDVAFSQDYMTRGATAASRQPPMTPAAAAAAAAAPPPPRPKYGKRRAAKDLNAAQGGVARAASNPFQVEPASAGQIEARTTAIETYFAEHRRDVGLFLDRLANVESRINGSALVENRIDHPGAPGSSGAPGDLPAQFARLENRFTQVANEFENRFDHLATNMGHRMDYDFHQMGQMQHRITQIEGLITQMEGRITQMGGRITQVEGRITQMEGRISHMEDGITQMEDRISQSVTQAVTQAISQSIMASITSLVNQSVAQEVDPLIQSIQHLQHRLDFLEQEVRNPALPQFHYPALD